MSAGSPRSAQTARFLPDDAARAVLWRFEDRADVLALALAARAAARGPLATGFPRAGQPRDAAALRQALEGEGVGPAALGRLASHPDGSAATLGLALAAFELATEDAGPAAALVGLPMPADGVVGGGPLRAAADAGSSSGTREDVRRRAVAVGVMTAAKLLSALDPVLAHHGPTVSADGGAIQRAIDIWAAGEAAASIGFEAARTLDRLDTLALRHRGSGTPTPPADPDHARRDALALCAERARPSDKRNAARINTLDADPRVQQALLDALAAVLCPAVRLWDTGHGVHVLREALSLLGDAGLAPAGPGAIGYKWLDAQVEAASEPGDAALRRQLAGAMVDDVFLAQYRAWVDEMRQVASDRPGTGACLLASVMQMWLWTLRHLRRETGVDGRSLLSPDRDGVGGAMAEALCWILTSHQQIQDVFELERRTVAGTARPAPALLPLLADLCHVLAARAAGEVGRICAELLYGYRRHPAWDRDGCATCYVADELEALDEVIPGMGAAARFYGDVIEVDGSHPAKAGPCAHTDGLEPFLRMRTKVDGCLTGCRVAKDRAAAALVEIAQLAR